MKYVQKRDTQLLTQKHIPVLHAKRLQEAMACFSRKISNAQQREGLKSVRLVITSKKTGNKYEQKERCTLNSETIIKC